MQHDIEDFYLHGTQPWFGFIAQKTTPARPALDARPCFAGTATSISFFVFTALVLANLPPVLKFSHSFRAPPALAATAGLRPFWWPRPPKVLARPRPSFRLRLKLLKKALECNLFLSSCQLSTKRTMLKKARTGQDLFAFATFKGVGICLGRFCSSTSGQCGNLSA